MTFVNTSKTRAPSRWPARPYVTSLLLLAALATVERSAADEPGKSAFSRHVVVAQEMNAADVGREILRRGGTSVDAAVATAFALAVTLPEAGNLGGGGFLVAYDAGRHEVFTLDFREAAPRAATPTMYLDSHGRLVLRHRAGVRAAGVPGTVRGLAVAHQHLGRLPWADLVRPAARLAREGFEISGQLAQSLNSQLASRGQSVAGSGGSLVAVGERVVSARPQNEARAQAAGQRTGGERLADFPESVAAFARPGEGPWRAGDRLVQRDLADTLERIARDGPDDFYRGRTADLIVNYSASHGGLITHEDLAGYQAFRRPPVSTSFHGYDVYGMGPVASGGIVLSEMLGMLEGFDLKADGPLSERTIHRVTEAMRRAFFVRATRLADPNFVEVPVAELSSKAFARELARSITDRATPSAQLAPFPVADSEGDDTTHLSALDGQGNAVALTYTLEEAYGSKAVVAGGGFLLNNEMGDFNLIPGRTDTTGRIGTIPNQIEPGKRMLSSQCPTIVMKEGKVRLITGSPGGRTIPNTVLWVVLNVLDFKLDPRTAVDAPRTHHAWFPDSVVLEGKPSRWDPAVLRGLRARGHQIRFSEFQGDANSVMVDPRGGIHGIADRRRGTEKASGD